MSQTPQVEGLLTSTGELRFRAESFTGTEAQSGFMQQLRAWVDSSQLPLTMDVLSGYLTPNQP